jgi:hypothetical protein
MFEEIAKVERDTASPLPMLLDDAGRVARDVVPNDHETLDEHRKRRGPFDGESGAVAGVARAGDVFGFMEGGLDRPAVAPQSLHPGTFVADDVIV